MITELAVDRDEIIGAGEFQTLHRCLDEASCAAVTAFLRRRERVLHDENTERLGALAHELGNALNVAMLSFACIKRGTVAAGGATGAMVDRSFVQIQRLVDRSLADVRLDAGKLNVVRVPVWELLEEAEIAGAMFAEENSVRLQVLPVDHSVIVEGDRAILAAAITNLVQNGFKFTRTDTSVVLRATTRRRGCSSRSKTTAAACPKARPRVSCDRSCSEVRIEGGWGSGSASA